MARAPPHPAGRRKAGPPVPSGRPCHSKQAHLPHVEYLDCPLVTFATVDTMITLIFYCCLRLDLMNKPIIAGAPHCTDMG
jgi:hypothetical protein